MEEQLRCKDCGHIAMLGGVDDSICEYNYRVMGDVLHRYYKYTKPVKVQRGDTSYVFSNREDYGY